MGNANNAQLDRESDARRTQASGVGNVPEGTGIEHRVGGRAMSAKSVLEEIALSRAFLYQATARPKGTELKAQVPF